MVFIEVFKSYVGNWYILESLVPSYMSIACKILESYVKFINFNILSVYTKQAVDISNVLETLKPSIKQLVKDGLTHISLF